MNKANHEADHAPDAAEEVAAAFRRAFSDEGRKREPRPDATAPRLVHRPTSIRHEDEARWIKSFFHSLAEAATPEPAAPTTTPPPEKRTRKRTKFVIPDGYFPNQQSLAVALETSQKNISQWIHGKGNPPQGFCWPFPINQNLVAKCKNELRQREAHRRATKIAVDRRKQTKVRYNPDIAEHNPPQI